MSPGKRSWRLTERGRTTLAVLAGGAVVAAVAWGWLQTILPSPREWAALEPFPLDPIGLLVLACLAYIVVYGMVIRWQKRRAEAEVRMLRVRVAELEEELAQRDRS